MNDWTPRRNGDTYCAPACGRGCTFQEFDEATRKGAALAAALGASWSVRVWENLGWHYSALSPCRRIEVYTDSTEKRFTAFLGEAKEGGGGGGRWAATAGTPRAAVYAVIAEAEAELAKLGAVFTGLVYEEGA